MSRIAIYGGSFNPVHTAHLIIAEELRQLFALDEIIFVPADQPPHKPVNSLVDAKHRLAMLKLAIEDNPHFKVSDIEIQRGGLSYTVDTLSYFKEQLGQSGQLYFIVGSDAFVELDTWKQPHELFDLARFIVIERPGVSLKKAVQFLEKFHPLPCQIIKDSLVSCAGLSCSEKSEIIFTQATLANISSSRVRELVGKEKSIRYIVPEKVRAYINAHGLYK